MSKLIKTALISGLIILPLSVAHAAGKTKMDTSGDGVVTFTEFAAHADTRFNTADADANGFVTKDERKAAKQANMAERRAAKFAKTDANSDGVLTLAEIEARTEAKRAERTERTGERPSRKDRVKGEGKRGQKKTNRVSPDTDGDGQVSFAEHTVSVQAKFTKLDANADGVLSADEMPKKRRKRGKRGKRGNK